MKKLALVVTAAAMVTFAGSGMAGKPGTKGNGLPFVDMSDSWTLVIHSRPYDKCPTSGYDDTNRRSLVVAALPEFDSDSPNPHGGKVPDMSDFNDIELMSNTSLDNFYVVHESWNYVLNN